MKRGLGLLLFIVAVGGLRPVPSPAAEDRGTAADVFGYVTMDLTGVASASVQCEAWYGAPAQPVVLFQTVMVKTDGSMAGSSFVVPPQGAGGATTAPPVEAGVTFESVHVNPAVEPVDPKPVVVGADLVGVRFEAPTSVRRASIAFAVWNSVRPLCRAVRDGVPVPLTFLAGGSARMYYVGQFDGVTAHVKSAGGVSVDGRHEHDVAGDLLGLFSAPLVENGAMSTTAPDGAIAVGRREIYNGVPGRWRFDLDGTVYPGERAPALTLLDLPANWDA